MNKVSGGILLSFVGIFLSLIMYMLGPDFLTSDLFTGVYVGLVSFVVVLGAAIFVSIKIRESKGGLISFKALFLELLVVSAILVVISTVFEYVLYGLVDPGYMETALQNTLDNIYEASNGNMDEEALAKQEKAMKGQFDKTSIGAQALGMIWKMIFWTVVSVILAAIFKKKAPEFEG